MGKNSSEEYYEIPQTMFTEGTVSAGATGLCGEIRLLTQKGTCFATNSYFAQKFSRDTRTIQRWLDELAKQKWILRGFGESGNRYLAVLSEREGEYI
jgi:hypothetical protein